MKEKVEVVKSSALILDDDPVQGAYLKRLLERDGLYTVLVDDPDVFQSELNESDYDIVFIDYLMPTANGISVFQNISAAGGKPLTAPAILLDNDITDSFGREIFSTGFTNYLEKPVDMEQLDAVLYLYLPRDRVKLKRQRHLLHERKDTEQEGNPAEPEPVVPDWLYTAKGLSVKDGLRNCGSVDSFLSAVRLFYGSIEKKAREIEEFQQGGDLENYTIWVHALKSSARIIGISHLSEEALQMEKAGSAGNREAIDRVTPDLIREYRSYLDILHPISEDNRADALPPVDADVLQDAYDSLSGFVDAMDYDLVEMVLNSMKEYSLPDEDEKRMKALGEKLLDLDWDGMKAVIAEEEDGH